MFKGKKTTELLSQVKVFQGLERADLKMISDVCERIAFERGETLIRAGQFSPGLYILVKGEVKVLLPERLKGGKAHRPSEVNLNTLRQGDCFGEYSLLEKSPASASVVGAQAGEVLRIPEPGFNRIMADDRIGRTVYRNLLHILIKRLRKKEEELDLVLVAG
ncbi:MAG: cyclic nucleotide-binding domain-containing protein [Deltaproteobacteria bacterium]|nr:cyclic nucleotide-binding domain-containing protein [Deltaproteobacteria bacterium]MBW2047760.1 cyclic nucleotide-binding domain-containing protein [Deltaproteobacteria bacterium]MBW2110704.1 cyclic nucleotide-binding domain-containing protein [Deltaproteobacteria bacterium]HDZ89810.1 cyclic nucleotide-binding domain-containing protein [Deltaproteobacteria bacterium]